MYLVPNVPGKLGSMTNPLRYESDFDFAVQTAELQGTEPIWREEIIVISDPPDWWPKARVTSNAVTRWLDRVRGALKLRTRLRALRSA